MRRRVVSATLALAIVLGYSNASACGSHDDAYVARGTLHLSYPDALHVGTAVWMAERDGRLDRDPLRARVGLTSERRGRLTHLQALHWLRQLQVQLGTAASSPQRFNVAVLLLGPMLWSRYSVEGANVTLDDHVEGPVEGDLVAITELPVVRALAQRRLSVQEAMALNVIRFYGDPAATSLVVQWMARAGDSSAISKNAALTTLTSRHRRH